MTGNAPNLEPPALCVRPWGPGVWHAAGLMEWGQCSPSGGTSLFGDRPRGVFLDSSTDAQ